MANLPLILRMRSGNNTKMGNFNAKRPNYLKGYISETTNPIDSKFVDQAETHNCTS